MKWDIYFLLYTSCKSHVKSYRVFSPNTVEREMICRTDDVRRGGFETRYDMFGLSSYCQMFLPEPPTQAYGIVYFFGCLTELCFMFTGKWQRLYLVCTLAAVQCRNIKVCIVIFHMLEWGCAFDCNCIHHAWDMQFLCSSTYRFIKLLVLFCFSGKFILLWHQSIFCQYVFVWACMHACTYTHSMNVM